MPNVAIDKQLARVLKSQRVAEAADLPWPFDLDYVEGTCELCLSELEPEDWIPGIGGGAAHVSCIRAEGVEPATKKASL